MSQENAPLNVIGVGMGRTGTKSLKTALEILYQQPCYHMTEVVFNHLDHVQLWTKLYDLVDADPEADLPKDVIDKIFKGYSNSTDHPACTIYRQLMKIYPNAKLILTVRDSKSWIESVRSTIRPKDGSLVPRCIDSLMQRFYIAPGFQNMSDMSIRLALGSSIDLNNDEQMVQAFEHRNQQIQQTVPPERLLVFHVKEGWEPLCRFLDKPIPDQPFPRVNDREELQGLISKKKKQAAFWVTLTVASIGILTAFGFRWLLQIK